LFSVPAIVRPLLRLFNNMGQQVLTRSLPATAGRAVETEVDVHGLAPGIYNLRLDVAGTPITRKVVARLPALKPEKSWPD
jgi:hypothetical protein